MFRSISVQLLMYNYYRLSKLPKYLKLVFKKHSPYLLLPIFTIYGNKTVFDFIFYHIDIFINYKMSTTLKFNKKGISGLSDAFMLKH